MSGVSMCRVVWVEGWEGALWLPAWGKRASQGTFSSFFSLIFPVFTCNYKLTLKKAKAESAMFHLFLHC